MKTEYISCVETAKLIRKELKVAFPGIKFSVRSDTYTGGASIRVGWTDGPSEMAVKAIVGMYAGASFDGMIDLKTSNYHWRLPDGTIKLAVTGCGHSFAEETKTYPKPEGAEKVHFGANYIFTDREYSVELLTKIVSEVCKEWGEPMPKIVDTEYSGAGFAGRLSGLLTNAIYRKGRETASA